MDADQRFTKGLPVSAVPESLRIRFTRELHALREGEVSEVVFSSSLSAVERKFLHSLSQELGLTSKSRGKDENRFITVTKGKKKGAGNEQVEHPFFEMLPKTEEELRLPVKNYLHVLSSLRKARYSSKNGCGGSSNNGDHKGKRSPKSAKPLESIDNKKKGKFYLPSKDTAEHFQKRQQQRKQNKEYSSIQHKRKSLPSLNHVCDVVEMVRHNQVCLISGETGCGKSTQVPQFILDDPEMGPNCRIAVTQPRRISATSVAERIAYERSEKIGDIVGYNIRLESEVSANSKLVFMTPGVLLRIAQEDPNLTDFTHIIIDEAHERDRYTEFLFILFRDMMTKSSGNNSNLEKEKPNTPKLILMSATLQTQKLSDYFGGIPNLHIGSSVHPVQQFYLEHVLKFVGFFGEEGAAAVTKRTPSAKPFKAAPKYFTCPICNSSQKFLSSEELGTHVASCFGIIQPITDLQDNDDDDDDDVESGDEEDEPEDDCISDDENGAAVEENEHEYDFEGIINSSSTTPHFDSNELSKADEELLHKYQVSWNDSETDYELIENLLEYICKSEYARESEATILVFLPGWETISTLSKNLLDSEKFGDENKFKIVSLHSGIPKNLQKEAFQPAPAGVIKIVLSTNIAETSVTIDNVTVVIDTGRAKEKTYDPHLKLSSLKENWISQSSARQRKGRAGRTRPGVCFRLYSSRRHDSLAMFQESEMLRTSLEEVALLCKMMGLTPGKHPSDPDSLHNFLSKAMDPPHALAITNAVELLENINCFDKESGEITPLGAAVSQLPVDPCVGRLMILGLMLGCGPNAVSTGCAMSYRDPFVMPISDKQRARSNAMRKQISGNTPSDQLAIVRALLEFTKVASNQGFRGLQRFCDEYFLSRNTMSYLQSLCQSVSQNLLTSTGIDPHSSYCLRNNQNFLLLNSLVGFGLYSNVAVRKRAISTFLTEKGRKAKIHPASINSTTSSNSASAFSLAGKSELEVIGFQDLVALDPNRGKSKDSRIGGASVQMLNTSSISVFALLLACGSVERQSSTDEEQFVLSQDDGERGQVLCVVDHWLPIRMKQETFQFILDIRECFRDAISCFLMHHSKRSSRQGHNLPAHVAAFIDKVAVALVQEHTKGKLNSHASLNVVKNHVAKNQSPPLPKPQAAQKYIASKSNKKKK